MDEVNSLKAQLASLTNALSKLSKGSQAQESPSSIASLAAMANQQGDNETANYVDKGQYRCQQQLPTHYHPNLRNHENFSYANKKNVLQAPQGFNGAKNAKTSSLEVIMLDFVKESRSRTTILENSVQAIASTVQSQGKAIQSLKVQLSQMATYVHTMQKGKFPNFSKKNPEEECNAITLRSDKELK